MLLKPWDGLRKVYSCNLKDMDPAKVNMFLQQMDPYVKKNVTEDLHKQILKGSIGMEMEKTSGDYRGSFTKRVQSYLWKNYGFQFEDKGNMINNFFSTATKDLISEDLYGRFDPSFNWAPGDFGDAQSCFWLGNSIARYYMKGMKNAYAFCLYTKIAEPNPAIKVRPYHKTPTVQDNVWYQGYGRCWALFNWPNDEVITIFNAYPSGTLLNAFVQSLQQGLSQLNPSLVELLSFQSVNFTNQGSGGGWFYTNNGTATLLGSKKGLEKAGREVDLGAKQPVLEKFPDFGSKCLLGCGKYAWKDRPSVWGVDYSGDRGGLCEQCLQKKKREYVISCDLCGLETVYYPNFETFNFCAKQVTLEKNGASRLACPDCFSKLDREKYSCKHKPYDKFKGRELPQDKDVAFMEEIGHTNFFQFAH